MSNNIPRYAIAFLFALLPTPIFAAPLYSVSPLLIDIDAQPRDIITREIIVTNTGTEPLTIYPTVNNISLTQGGTIQEFVPRVMSDSMNSLAAWTEISRKGENIPIGGQKSFSVTFRIHPTPEPGEYHAFIGFGNGTTRDDAERMVAQGRAPGVITTVVIKDESNEILRLSRFVIDRFITSRDNDGVTYTIVNPGDEDLVPGGEIIFYDSKGTEVGSVEVNKDREVVPVGAEKQFSVAAPAEGLFGKYKAYLSVDYGTAQLASVQDTTFFYVVPLKTILIILGILTVLTVLISFYVHRRFFDDEDLDEDSERLPFHIRESVSDARDHDIDLKQP